MKAKTAKAIERLCIKALPRDSKPSSPQLLLKQNQLLNRVKIKVKGEKVSTLSM